MNRHWKRLKVQITARWSAFAGEADSARRASNEISSVIRQSRVTEESSIHTVQSLKWPVAGRQTSRFGMRNGRMHEGLDMALKAGSPIYPAMPGVVLLAGELGSYGNVVVIEHGGSLATVYAHLQSISVAKGSRVGCEDSIGAVGSTGRAFGPHLHFEVRFDGTAVEPLVFLEEAGPTAPSTGNRSDKNQSRFANDSHK